MHIPASKAVGLAAAVLVSSGAALVASGGTAVAACDTDAYVITAPAPGATVSGTVPLAANRTNTTYGAGNGVEFSVDGTLVDTTASGSTLGASWDSTAVADGSHTLTVAYGAGYGGCGAGSPASAPVVFTVDNGNPAPTVGVTTLTTDSSGTATATSTSATGATLTTVIKGTGTATVGWYSSPPQDAPETSAGSFFDVKVPAGSGLTEVTLSVDVPAGTNSAFFLDPRTGRWAPVIGGVVDNGVLRVTLTGTSVPSIADLTGTVFTPTVLPRGDISAACDTAGGAPFADMATDVHAASAACLAAYGIAKGTSATTFGPTTKVTRAQVAEFLARLLAKAGVALPPAGAQRFADVPMSMAHSTAVNQLAQLKVVNGLTTTTFGPGRAVTRAQMASLLVRAYEKAAGTTVAVASTGFGDVGGDVHATDIGKLVGLGVTQGVTATRFAPAQSVPRDQMATFLARELSLLVLDGKAPLQR